jgi:hypothetical protein
MQISFFNCSQSLSSLLIWAFINPAYQRVYNKIFIRMIKIEDLEVDLINMLEHYDD